MKKLTLEDYITLSERFNSMSFVTKIKTLIDNKDILTLASDHNWWVVKTKDTEIQELLEEIDSVFTIENEWDSEEIHNLVYLLGLEVTDI